MTKYKINISEKRHCKDLESLGSIFVPLVKDSISSKDLIGTDIILKWRDIVGTEMAGFCHPIKTKCDPKTENRTLYLEVPVGGFALEIQHKERYIIEKINAYFGYNAIHKLNISQNANMKPTMIGNKEDKKEEPEISKEDMDYLILATKEISDEKLRENLIKIGKNIILVNKE